MIVFRLSGNAVPGAVSLFELGHHSAIVLLLASMLSRIMPLDFVLWVHCRFYRHNRVVTLSLLRLNLSLTIDIAFLGTYRNCRADLPTAHCRLITFGRNTTEDCFTSLPDTSNFLTTLSSFLYLVCGYWVCFLAIAFYP